MVYCIDSIDSPYVRVHHELTSSYKQPLLFVPCFFKYGFMALWRRLFPIKAGWGGGGSGGAGGAAGGEPLKKNAELGGVVMLHDEMVAADKVEELPPGTQESVSINEVEMMVSGRVTERGRERWVVRSPIQYHAYSMLQPESERVQASELLLEMEIGRMVSGKEKIAGRCGSSSLTVLMRDTGGHGSVFGSIPYYQWYLAEPLAVALVDGMHMHISYLPASGLCCPI